MFHDTFRVINIHTIKVVVVVVNVMFVVSYTYPYINHSLISVEVTRNLRVIYFPKQLYDLHFNLSLYISSVVAYFIKNYDTAFLV